MFDASIDSFMEAVAEATLEVLGNAGEDVLAMAADNVKHGYEKPELGWDPVSDEALKQHVSLGHIPLAQREYHSGLLHREYAGIVPNLYDSLFKGNPGNIFETAVVLADGITMAEGNYGTRFMAARRHEYGIGTVVVGKDVMHGVGVPARPFMAPAIAKLMTDTVVTDDQGRYFAFRLNLELTSRGLI